jgi:hypothetical protein
MTDDLACAIACEICGSPRPAEDDWFLLSASRWQDRLKIMSWNEEMAQQNGVYLACGAAHVRELVAHWLITGSLDYPFARLAGGQEASCSPEAEPCATAKAASIGELAVHRESLERLLAENPCTLTSILEALMQALTKEARSDEVVTEEALACAIAQA